MAADVSGKGKSSLNGSACLRPFLENKKQGLTWRGNFGNIIKLTAGAVAKHSVF